MALKALLVDFDGTLVDSMPIVFELYKEFLQKYGAKPSEEEFNELNGMQMRSVIGILIEKHQLDTTPNHAVEHYFGKLNDLYAKHIQLFPGVAHCIQNLHSQNIRLAVVTAAPRQLVDVVLQRCGVLEYFDQIIALEEQEKGKPDPSIYLRALHALGVTAEDAIAVEDAENGILAAQNAGIEVIHFTPDLGWNEVETYIIQRIESFV